MHNKKLIIALAIVAVTVFFAGVVFVVSMYFSKHQNIQEIPTDVEYISETDGNTIEAVEDYETLGSSVEYSGGTQNPYVVVDRVTFQSPLNEYINVDSFVKAVEYGTVLDFAGGNYGIFNVKFKVDRLVYDGVWDDAEGVWYWSVDEYNVQSE